MPRSAFLAVFIVLALIGCDRAPPDSATTLDSRPRAAETVTDAPAGVRTLAWDELMPADFDPSKAIQELDAAALTDADPQAQALLVKLRKLWDEAPIVPELDGLQVRLPGFAVPLQATDQKISQFLLVPYFGACIHVPPPPANQTVLVEAPMGASIQRAFETVWVTGRLSAKSAATDFAKAGYILTAVRIEPYQDR